jgi:hypothetical protein
LQKYFCTIIWPLFYCFIVFLLLLVFSSLIFILCAFLISCYIIINFQNWNIIFYIKNSWFYEFLKFDCFLICNANTLGVWKECWKSRLFGKVRPPGIQELNRWFLYYFWFRSKRLLYYYKFFFSFLNIVSTCISSVHTVWCSFSQ